jgi:type II secretory pathway pseudopilin PulG
MIFFIKSKKSGGQSLLELLVALTLIMLVVVAVVGLAAVSIKASYFAKRETASKRYAEEAMEWLREYKKNNWHDLLANKADADPGDIDFCLNNLNFSTAGACTSFLGGIYKRELKIYKYDLNPPQKPKVDVEVLVSWSDSSGNHLTRLKSIFTSPD